jgi:hypothetical protein
VQVFGVVLQISVADKLKLKLIPVVQLYVGRAGIEAMFETGLHPPETTNPAFHVLYADNIAAGVLQAGKLTEAGQVVTKAGAVTIIF